MVMSVILLFCVHYYYILLLVLEKAVDYGVECRMKELDISHLEGLKKELDLVQSRLSGVVARMSALKADYGQREKG